MRAGRIPLEESVRAVRETAEALAGASLGERGDALAELAVRQALAYCQREDVPEDMEPAAAVLLLALAGRFPRSGGDAPDEADPEETAASGGTALREPGLEGVVKSVQRGDTTITFDTSAGASSAGSGLSGSAADGEPFPGGAEALAGLNPWRRLGRLKKEAL